MWPWTMDESQQTIVIAILGFISAFLLTHYFLSFRNRSVIKGSSNSYDELIESLLSQYSAKFMATTKIIESISLRLELLETAVKQTKSVTKSEVVTSKSVDRLNNLSLLSNSNVHDDDNRSDNVSDMDTNSDIIKAYHELHHDNDNHYNDAEDVQDMRRLVLKLLSERSMSSIEIQSKISRTREHTSRFMKRLFVEGLVSRDMNTKPFVYTLTDEGHKRLKVFRSDV